MTNTPWEAASSHYKKIVFSSMGVIAVGIILTIIGSTTHTLALVYTAIGLLVLGMLLHVAGLFVRARDTRNWRRANGLAENPRAAKNKNSTEDRS